MSTTTDRSTTNRTYVALGILAAAAFILLGSVYATGVGDLLVAFIAGLLALAAFALGAVQFRRSLR